MTRKKAILLVLVVPLSIGILLLATFFSAFPKSCIHVPAGLLRVLLPLVRDVNAKDDMGFTALHYCSILGRTRCVALLISQGADLESKNNQGWTPLHAAVLNYLSANDTIRLLLEKGANIEATTDKGETSLILAAGHADDPNLIEYFLTNSAMVSAKDDTGRTALHYAVEFEKYFAAKALLDKGADILPPDANGVTPLDSALMLMHKRFAQLLVDRVGPSQKDIYGRTALHIVANAGEAELARVLVQKGADIHAKDRNGHSPLESAKQFNPPDSEILKYLESLE